METKVNWKAIVLEIASLRSTISSYASALSANDAWNDELWFKLDDAENKNKKLQKKLKKAKKK